MQKTTSEPCWNFKDSINMHIKEIHYERVNKTEVVQKKIHFEEKWAWWMKVKNNEGNYIKGIMRPFWEKEL